MKKLLQVLIVIASCFALTALGGAASLGGVAQNVMGPVSGLSKIVNAICYVAGTGFLLGGVLQYRYHRENPQQVRISTPIVLVILGLIIIGIPFISMWSESARALH